MPLSAQAVVTDQEDGLLPPPQLADAEAVAGDGSKKKQPLPPGQDEDNPKPGNAGAAFFPETPGPAAAPGGRPVGRFLPTQGICYLLVRYCEKQLLDRK